MKQNSPVAHTSGKYSYLFNGLVGVLVLTALAVGVSSRSVDPKRRAAEANEKQEREHDGPGSSPQSQTQAAHPLSTASVVCNTVSNTVTCTGGPGASYNFTGHTGGTVVAASPFPSTIPVTGASAGSTVSSMTLTLHGYTSSFVSGSERASRGIGLLLVSPANHNLQVMRFVGQATFAQSNMTVTLQDGAAAIPSSNGNDSPNGPWQTSGTYAPSAWDATFVGNGMLKSPNYTAVGAPAMQHSAPPNGTAPNTLSGVFAGDAANGNWSLYMVNDDEGAAISFSSWDIVITFSGATTPSTTTLSPNPTTAYRTSPNNSVTLTATVTAGATGTVLFKDGATSLTCSQGSNPRPVSSNQAVCTTSFSTEGVHSLSAVYSGDGTFVTSTGTTNVFIQNHATNVGTTYCNAGALTNDGHSDTTYSSTSPYPSVIFVGDGVNTDLLNSVSTVSLQLKSFSSTQTPGMHMLLVAPDGTHALNFWGDAGAGSTTSTGDYTLIDGGPQLPNAPISPGTYGPTSYFNTDVFTPAPPSPAPQIPGSFQLAAPAGSKTFQTSFVGTAAHGAWSLYLWNANGTTSASGGWCLNISPATGHPTTVNVNSNPFPTATKGASVTFTATVSSSPTPTVGTVSFTENGAPLVGAPNGGAATVNGSGVATISTSGLPEGDHTITASYHDSTNTFNDNFGTVTMRVDAATATPTLNGSTWTYCNPSGIVIPRGVNFVDDIGAAAPNPSNVFVTNLPGTINSASLTLKGFHVTSPGDLESLLVGPGAATANTLDFYSLTGGSGGSTAFGPQDTTFSDAGTLVPAAGPTSASSAPTSRGATTYFASPFYTLPGTVQHATTQGSATFRTGGGGVYQNTIANGTWSLYFNQLIHHSGDGTTSWCLNFIENPVTGTGTTAHVGPAPNNHMRQGGTGSVTFSLLNNGNGATGDPDQAVAHAMTVTGTLPAGLTLGTVPTGSPWNCTANTTTQVTCTNLNATAQGSSYSLLTIPVNVAANAPASATISGFTFSGAGMTAGTFASDTITIDPAPILAVNKSHTGTFANGHTAVWNIQVSNNSATAAGATDGSTVTVTDALPSGYTFVSAAGGGWSCSGTTTVTCTSSAVVAGAGGTFNSIALTVNVAANSPTSVANIATAFGGGDIVHTNSGNAVSSNTDTTAATNTMVWNGTVSGDWNTAANWTPAVVPNSGNNASIPTGVLPNEPSLSSAPDAAITDLTVASGASLTIGSTRTLSVNGNASVDGQILGSGAVQFASGAHNLGGAGSFTSTIGSTLVSGANVSLTSNMQMGSLIINSGATMNLVSHTLSLSGTPTPLTVSGTLNNAITPVIKTNAARSNTPEISVAGTIQYNGSAAQSAPGISYGGLTINNSSGVTLSGNASVGNALTLTSGDLDTGAFTLTQPSTAPASTGTGDVVGSVKRTGAPLPSNTALTFGNPDTRITITSGVAPTDITVKLTKSVPTPALTGFANSGYPTAVTRTYIITPNGGSPTATLRLHYNAGEVNGNDPTTMNLWRFDSGSSMWRPSVTTGRGCSAGCPTNTSNLWAESSGVAAFSPWTLNSTNATTASNGIVSGRIVDGNGAPVEGAVVNLSGAQTRKLITDANGNYQFDNVQTDEFYTVTPSRAHYHFNPFNRSFNQTGNKTDAVFTGISTGDNANPLDTPEYFVRQQYVDILSREPDEGGFNYWSDQILACNGDAQCTSARRRDVAAAFFIEQEAQQTGSYIYDAYTSALGRQPVFNEYKSDRQQVVGGAALDAEKAAFAQAFVQRAEFTAKYQANTSAESFVDALIQNASQSAQQNSAGSGANPTGDLNSQRAALIAAYNSGGSMDQSRALVVQALADNATFKQSQYNAAFVLTEYFSYLRRDAEPEGYNFWLNVLNFGDVNNYRGMVCSFITSAEYQKRFSNVVSHNNTECGQ